MTDPGKATARSPFAGCAIFICVVLMIVFLMVISVFTFFRQYKEIVKFTDDKPVVVEVTPTEGREAELNALAERLEGFRQQIMDGKEATLALSADDLNSAIAVYEPLKEFRGTLRFTEIGEKDAKIAISFPLNGKPRRTREGEEGFITTDRRFLNGTLTAKPELFEGEVVLQISDIQVPDKTVVREFTERMSPHRLAENYKTDPILGPAMKQLTGVEITDGKIVFRRKEGEKIASSIDNKQVDSASNRLFKFLGVAASIFLAFVALVIFLSARGRKNKGEDA